MMTLLEDVGTLKNLPNKWKQLIVRDFGGENSNKVKINVKLGQKAKVSAAFKDTYNNSPVIALIGYDNDNPVFMIIRESYEKNKYKLFKGDEQYVNTWQNSKWVPGNKHNNYRGRTQTWNVTDTYHRLPDILNELPDANYSIYIITQDEQRKDKIKQRHDIRQIPVQLSGLKKTNILNHLTKKLKPEIETVLNDVKQIANNITLDTASDIIAQMQTKLKSLDSLKTNIRYAEIIVDDIFSGESGTLQNIMDKKISANSWSTRKYNRFIALLQQGILNAEKIYSTITN